jgi:hypothetical protein
VIASEGILGRDRELTRAIHDLTLELHDQLVGQGRPQEPKSSR